MALNAKEQHMEDCLTEIFNYCREHKNGCEGCIFYRKISTIGLTLGVCRVLDAPDVFGYRKGQIDE